MNIKTRLYSFFIKKDSFFFAELYKNYKKNALIKIKACQNVFIDETFICGDYSAFNMPGKCTLLQIGENVSCK